MAEITDAEVNDLWRDHGEHCESERRDWLLYRSLYRSKMWKEGRPFGMSEEQMRRKLPYLVEGNKFQPWMSAMVSSMFLRRPRAAVSLPSVVEAKGGRPASTTDAADAVRGLLDDWLHRAQVQDRAKRAYEMALMYEAAAFRIGVYDDDVAARGDYLDRIWVEAVPRWEIVLDRWSTPNAERFRGHVRYRAIEEAKDMVGDLGDVTPVPLADYLGGGLSAARTTGDGRHRGYAGYVQLLEFYDLINGTQKFYVIEGTGRGSVRRVGTTEEIPWRHANGMPACPLLPVVLLSDPEHPLNGIAAAARVATLDVERNLGGSIVINAARRDSARTYMARRGYLDAEAYEKLRQGNDLEVIEIDNPEPTGIQAFPRIDLPPSLAALFETMERFWRDAQGTADSQQGRQGNYLSAQEAQLLAMYGERAASALQAEMHRALAGLGATMLAILRDELEREKRKALRVRSTGKPFDITIEMLKQPWEVTIADAGSTPVGDGVKKQEISGLAPQLLQLAQLAFATGSESEPAPEPGAQVMARRLLEYITALHQLPEQFSPASLQATIAEALRQAAEAEQVEPEPEMPSMPPMPGMGEPAPPPMPFQLPRGM